MKNLLIGLFIMLLMQPVHSKVLFSVETDDTGKMTSAHIPELYDLDGFWVSEQIIGELFLVNKSYVHHFEKLLTPLYESDESISDCFGMGICSAVKQKQVFEMMEQVLERIMTNPFTYYGQGFEVINTYLGYSDSTWSEMYEFKTESNPIFEVSAEKFSSITTVYYCTETYDEDMSWLKETIIIKGITPKTFKIELSSEVCAKLANPSD